MNRQKGPTASRSGSILLETALVLPILMVLLLLPVQILQGAALEMAFRQSAFKAGRELQLLQAGLSTLGAIGGETVGRFVEDAWEKAFPGAAPPEGWDEVLESVLLEQVLPPLLARRIADWMRASPLDASWYGSWMASSVDVPESVVDSVRLEQDEDGNLLRMTVTGRMPIPLAGSRSVQVLVPIPLWDRGDGTPTRLSGSREDADPQGSDCIWELGNLERGRLIRQRFGGDLPLGFPVLSGFSEGEALVIHSMDLTRPTWSIPDRIDRELVRRIRSLAGFQGMEEPWGREGIRIRPEDIRSRRFLLVIPENDLPQAVTIVLERVRDEARALGVTFRTLPYGGLAPEG